MVSGLWREEVRGNLQSQEIFQSNPFSSLVNHCPKVAVVVVVVVLVIDVIFILFSVVLVLALVL